jgi:hypothetical protein
MRVQAFSYLFLCTPSVIVVMVFVQIWTIELKPRQDLWNGGSIILRAVQIYCCKYCYGDPIYHIEYIVKYEWKLSFEVSELTSWCYTKNSPSSTIHLYHSTLQT